MPELGMVHSFGEDRMRNKDTMRVQYRFVWTEKDICLISRTMPRRIVTPFLYLYLISRFSFALFCEHYTFAKVNGLLYCLYNYHYSTPDYCRAEVLKCITFMLCKLNICCVFYTS